MKIFNWNLYMKNRRVSDSLDFALSHHADIYCFQEVNRVGLEYLKKLDSYHLVYRTEHYKKRKAFRFLVILSKYPIIKKENHIYSTDKNNSFFERSKFVNRFLEFYIEKKGSLSIEIETEIGIKKIHNVHFPLVIGPRKRFKQFNKFLEQTQLSPQDLVCGDLNTMNNPLYIYDLVSYFPFRYEKGDLFFREREAFDEIFKEKGLQNPFANHQSWPVMLGLLNRNQLDHVLVHQDFQIKYVSNFKKTYSSDHHPQMIEIQKNI